MSYYAPDGERWFAYYKTQKELFDFFKNARSKAYAKGYSVVEEGRLRDLDRATKVEDVIPTTYPDFNELNEYIESFNEYSVKIDSGGSFEKQRLKLSEDKRFLFSFSLASKGLIRIPEYFSEEIAKKYPDMFNSSGKEASDETMVAGVVNPNLVQNFPLPNGKQFFFIKIENVEYALRQQQKGTGKMLEINPSANLIEGEDGMFFTDPSTFGDFSLKFSSSFKKSYIELPKKGGKGRYVDLYIPYDMMNSELNLRLTSSIPLLLASQYFQKAGIQTRINIMRPIFTKKTGTSSIFAIPIKDFNDPLDFNKLAVLRGISKVGGVMTDANGFNVQFSKNEEQKKRSSINTNKAYASDLMYDNEIALQEEFGRYKNWFYEEVKEGRIKSQLVDKSLMLTFSTQGILSADVNNLISNPNGSTSLKVKNNFFEILDTVDLYYNQNLGKVVKRIKERFEENNRNRISNPRSSVKEYMLYLAGKLYRDFIPDSGLYASSQEEIEESSKKYNMLLKRLKVEFEKLGLL